MGFLSKLLGGGVPTLEDDDAPDVESPPRPHVPAAVPEAESSTSPLEQPYVPPPPNVAAPVVREPAPPTPSPAIIPPLVRRSTPQPAARVATPAPTQRPPPPPVRPRPPTLASPAGVPTRAVPPIGSAEIRVTPRAPVVAPKDGVSARPANGTPVVFAPPPTPAELETAFEGTRHRGEAPAGEGTLPEDPSTTEELGRLFGKIAAAHVGQVRDFHIELGAGDTSRAWIEICRPAVASLRGAAEGLGYDELVAALREYDDVLGRVAEDTTPMVGGARRDELVVAFDRLRALLPDAFDVEAERGRREPIIVHSLLEQTPRVTRRAIHRLYAAGLSGLAAFYRTTATELAATSGVDVGTCDRILERFAAYRRDRAEQVPDGDALRERLAVTVRDLERKDEEFRAADPDADRVATRALRTQRSSLVREVEIVLAQLGEVKLVQQLRRYPVQRKVQRIQRYLRRPPPTATA